MGRGIMISKPDKKTLSAPRILQIKKKIIPVTDFRLYSSKIRAKHNTTLQLLHFFTATFNKE